MSQQDKPIERYCLCDISGNGEYWSEMRKNESGNFVKHEDYQKLEAALKMAIEALDEVQHKCDPALITKKHIKHVAKKALEQIKKVLE